MQGLERRFESVSVKGGVIAALTVLMLWPLSRVESLVNERQSLQHDAHAVIADGFGGPQAVGPPVLTVDTEQRTVTMDSSTKISTDLWTAGPTLHLTPDDVQIISDVTVEIRSKGIYSVPVYVATIAVTGQFKTEGLARLLAPEGDIRPLPSHATLQLPLSRVKYVRSLQRFEVGGQALRPAGGGVAGLEALSVPIDLTVIDRKVPLTFHIDVVVAGSESLHFLPLGSTTTVSARVGWPHPDFEGAFFPVSRQTNAQGYSANWQVLELNRAIPSIWRGNAIDRSVLATEFGVRLLQPSDLYTQDYRAVRYGILFVAITFACFFAWEHLVRGMRLHPMQYLLVGLALATFYLLLLALSEHIGFAVSYGVAAAALVALITTYIFGATNNRAAAGGIGAALAISYGLLYVILLSQDYALLLGSLLLFAILAALMLATRRLDWAKVGRGKTEQ
jgi:inner membrane protein